MIDLAWHALVEVVEATLPVLALILFFQLVILRYVPPDLRKMLVGAGIAMTGFFLFILGAKMSLIPMGMQIGEFMAGTSTPLVVLFAFVLGITVVYAEPAVRILAEQVEEVSSGSLRKRFLMPVMALGVGLALILSVVRILADLPLAYILLPGYLIVVALTLVAPKSFVPIAYDAGAVSTGPVSVNFVLPLTTGLAISLWGEQSGLLGFGVVGIVAMVPIAFMLLLGIVLRRSIRRE
jgi:hypothetical protein